MISVCDIMYRSFDSETYPLSTIRDFRSDAVLFKRKAPSGALFLPTQGQNEACSPSLREPGSM